MDTKASQKQLIGLITEHLSESIPVTRILTYKPDKSGAVTGKFESLNRVYNFVFKGEDVRYKPAMNMDNALFSDYYLERFDAAPVVAKGTRALPKCTSKSYSCKGNVGVRCLPLTQSCKVGNSAIGNERLGKIKNLSKSLASSGEDTTKTEATRAKIVEGRMALAVENRAKKEPKKAEKSNLIDLDDFFGDELDTSPTTKNNKPKAQIKAKAAKASNLESQPNSKEVLGEGAYGRVFITDKGTAYKESLDGSAISKNEVKLMDEAAKLGIAPELVGTYTKDKKIKGYEMEMLTDYTPLAALKKSSSKERSESVEALAQSLSVLHKNGIIHGDLHSENAMTLDGKVKLIDYGLSSRISADNPSRSQLERWKEEVNGYSRILSWELQSDGGKIAAIYKDTNKALLKANNLESLTKVYQDFRSKL